MAQVGETKRLSTLNSVDEKKFTRRAGENKKALSSLGVEVAHRRSQKAVRRSDAPTVQRPLPAQVVRQVTRGDAVKARQPLPEAAVVGVDVLYMDGATHALAGAQVDAFVGDTCFAREGPVGRMRIGDQEHVQIEHGQQVPVQLRCRDRAASRDEIVGPSGAVAGDQDADVLARDAAFGSHSTRRRAGRSNWREPFCDSSKKS